MAMWTDREVDPAVETLARHFAGLMRRLASADDPLVAAAAHRLSVAAAAGHSCIDLREIADGSASGPGPSSGDGTQRTSEAMAAALRGSGVVGASGEFRPLVLDAAGRLYLYRYWDYEQRLARALRVRAEIEEPVQDETLREALARYFPREPKASIDWQQIAAAVAVARRLCIISGGPGTGKTTTLVRILAILLELAGTQKLRIALAAPTGKAAARMNEAVHAVAGALPASAGVRDRLPSEASTLHRLLGSRRDGQSFRHGPENPLPVDVLIVDEVSMVDLSLFVHMLEALPRHARLIMLGDRDQLAAVEPGAVLGELCRDWGGYSHDFAGRLGAWCSADVPAADQAPDPLQNCMVVLTHNYRFGAASAIRMLAQAISAGDVEEALAALKQAPDGEIIWRTYGSDPSLQTGTRLTEVFSGYRAAVAAAADPRELLVALAQRRALCAHRLGSLGVDGINRYGEQSIRQRLPAAVQRPWYSGRPILITRNDYGCNLFNGDLGVVWRESSASAPAAWFDEGASGMRAVPTQRLPEHETAYALTVHKAQGSEFDRIVLVLPQVDSPVLTRELLYTAVTRARQQVEIWGDETILSRAVGRATQRASGLRDALARG